MRLITNYPVYTYTSSIPFRIRRTANLGLVSGQSFGIHTTSKRFSETTFKIYDGIIDKKVTLTTVRPNIINWYSCGPTVYDSAHIGHASSYIRQDVVQRIIEKLGGDISVVHIMGITDVDDKIIKKANELQVPWQSITQKYEDEFIQELIKLNIKLPQTRAKVSNFIPQIVAFIGGLVSSGQAYSTRNGNVYFDIGKYGNYGIFRKLESDFEEEKIGDVDKRATKDFALWKSHKPGEPFWPTPWGNGRPGWHIECSAMASHFFGTQLDIHSGGWDLMFPHHENEEAQCCARFNSKRWVTHWLHTGHLHFKGDFKMSKSLGNTLFIKDFLNNNSPNVLRMFCILAKYRSSLEYKPESIDNAKKVLNKFMSFLSDCQSVLRGTKDVTTLPGSESIIWKQLTDTNVGIHSSLTDDFDTPRAVAILLDFLNDFNRCIFNPAQQTVPSVDHGLVLTAQYLVQNFLDLVGIDTKGVVVEAEQQTLLEPIMTELIELRKIVRRYSLAVGEVDRDSRKAKIEERKPLTEACDQTRLHLHNYGIEIKDHGEKSSWTFKKS